MTNTVNGAAVQQPTIKKKSRAGEIWRRFRKNKLAVFGMILFALILLVAIFADAIVNYSVATTQVAADRLLAKAVALGYTDAFLVPAGKGGVTLASC